MQTELFWCCVCVFSYWMMCKLCSLPPGSVANLHSRIAAFPSMELSLSFYLWETNPASKVNLALDREEPQLSTDLLIASQ